MPKKTTKPAAEEKPVEVAVEHFRTCMVVVANGACNCPASRPK